MEPGPALPFLLPLLVALEPWYPPPPEATLVDVPTVSLSTFGAVQAAAELVTAGEFGVDPGEPGVEATNPTAGAVTPAPVDVSCSAFSRIIQATKAENASWPSRINVAELWRHIEVGMEVWFVDKTFWITAKLSSFV